MARAFLIDTNVISELAVVTPNPGVVDFLLSHHTVFLSVMTLHEIEYGLQLLPSGNRQDSLRMKMKELMMHYAESIIPLQAEEMHQAASLRSMAKRQGRVLNLADALIAAIARHHGLTVVTRNVKDFSGLDVAVHNPWN